MRRKPRIAGLVAAAVAVLAVPLVASPAQADTVRAKPYYESGNYAVQFLGTVSSDGAGKYRIQGTLYATCPSSIVPPEVTLGYGANSGGWHYETFACNGDKIPATIDITGDRPSGDKVDLIVGAAGGILHTWGYGKKVIVDPGV
ncbi:hypothetical protein [Streptomyces roseochromogenus]|uniref:Uncharacterized protein n=1 Tax=Streptomyces roseochromogenus subsp. oscitans DS 12.976 TaxID=1352936 RepID=V6KRW3_STRRC|nr:hypothetical protein [Streptomyces roseochromogenus]EST34867.1 hypothetical protein M878_08365 [Streptomyces roseochromogenus subsp. oscitans DS 12.976]